MPGDVEGSRTVTAFAINRLRVKLDFLRTAFDGFNAPRVARQAA